MPKELEQRLLRAAHQKGLSKERTGAYVYGTMKKIEDKKDNHLMKAIKAKANKRY